MALAYLLLGLVAMYGVYWTVKYIMLPPQDGDTASDKPQTKHPTKLHTTKPTQTKSQTSPTTTSPTTKGSQLCGKSGYEHDKKSGYCYRFSTSPLTWPEAKTACEKENATLTIARVRNDQNASEEFIQNLFRKHKASDITGDNKNYAAVGLFATNRDPEGGSTDMKLVDVTKPDSDLYIEDDIKISFAHHPKLTDINYTFTKHKIDNQDWVFMNRKGQLIYFPDDFKGPFICEYNASIHSM